MVKEKKLATLPSYQKKGFTFFAFENEAETIIDQFKDNIIDQYERKGFFEDMNYEKYADMSLKIPLLFILQNSKQNLIALYGKPAECLFLVILSSSASATSSLFTKMQADASPW